MTVAADRERDRPVAEAEALHWFAELEAKLAESPPGAIRDISTFCDDWSEFHGMCLDFAAAAGPWPGTADSVRFEPLPTGSGRLDVFGTDAHGVRYHSAIEVVRDDAGEVVAVDPVYWMDRGLSASDGLTSPTPTPTRTP